MADISYTRTTWADGSEGGTPIDATKLNNIEQGIVDAVGAIGPNDTTADGTLKAQIDALGESVSSKAGVSSLDSVSIMKSGDPHGTFAIRASGTFYGTTSHNVSLNITTTGMWLYDEDNGVALWNL